MDPDENLKEQRELLTDITDILDQDDQDELLEKVDRLTELARGMDEWLSRGGFLPKAWERKP